MTIPMTKVLYTPDDRFIITAAMDGSVRIWTHVFKQVSVLSNRFCKPWRFRIPCQIDNLWWAISPLSAPYDRARHCSFALEHLIR